MSKERTMQQALATAISSSTLWPTGAAVIVAKPGDLAGTILQAVGKAKLCAVVGEPDEIESVDGAPDFAISSKWTITVFSVETLNNTGVDNLDAAVLVRQILGNTNPGNYWEEPLGRCNIRFAGEQEGISARDVTFTAAYQGA
ncbi:MAG: hypothetical protein WCS65_09615 [Verrucomicrobiae bacterium]